MIASKHGERMTSKGSFQNVSLQGSLHNWFPALVHLPEQGQGFGRDSPDFVDLHIGAFLASSGNWPEVLGPAEGWMHTMSASRARWCGIRRTILIEGGKSWGFDSQKKVLGVVIRHMDLRLAHGPKFLTFTALDLTESSR